MDDKIITKDLGYKPYKKRNVQRVREASMKKLGKTKLIISRHAGQKFMFSDEKLFVLQLATAAQSPK